MSKKEKGSKARVEALEARLGRLEAALAQPGAVSRPGPEAPVEPPGDKDAGSGRLRLEVRSDSGNWRQDSALADLLAADWPGGADRLSALGHPLRLAILRLAIDGPVTASALQAGAAASGAAGKVSSGQLYHHLRELTATGWLEARGRGVYALPERRMGPLMAAVALARSD